MSSHLPHAIEQLHQRSGYPVLLLSPFFSRHVLRVSILRSPPVDCPVVCLMVQPFVSASVPLVDPLHFHWPWIPTEGSSGVNPGRRIVETIADATGRWLRQLISVCHPYAGAHALRACVEVVVEAIALHKCLVRLWQSGGGALVSAVSHSLFPRETGNSLQNMDEVQVAQ